MPLSLETYRYGSNHYCVLSPEFNPQKQTDGRITVSVDPNRIASADFVFPSMQVSFSQPQTKTVGPAKITTFLKKNHTPKVIVRLPERLTDVKSVESIELELSGLGWEVIDHNMASGCKSVEDIKNRTGANLILDISWLKFSDPDMFTPLDIASVSIAPFETKNVVVSDAYYAFKNEKNFKKWKKSNDLKEFASNRQIKNNYIKSSLKADMPYRDYIIRNMAGYERFNTNKNVISAVFKLIDSSNGSILGYFHIGEVPNYKIISGKKICECYFKSEYNFYDGYYDKDNYVRFVDTSDFYNEYRYVMKDNLLLLFLSYLDVFLPNGEIPFAAQLNEMEDVKLSDETVNESHSSTSTTSGSYSGHSRDYYNAYFNSRYYSGAGSGYSSGNSSSQTNTSGSSTTSFKEAEYIRYSDFFGYYKPLTEKFVQEIRKITE